VGPAFRRANIPVAYSQGFNPGPKITIAAALPLGMTSDCELMDVVLDAPVPVPDFLARLAEQLPPGARLLSAVEVSPEAPPLRLACVGLNTVLQLMLPPTTWRLPSAGHSPPPVCPGSGATGSTTCGRSSRTYGCRRWTVPVASCGCACGLKPGPPAGRRGYGVPGSGQASDEHPPDTADPGY